jgi:hypothetical protein
MNNISTWRVVCTVRRALWFSFVTAPALSFFVGFVFLSFNNSLAGEFMEEARSLVADAPPGKVWDCIPPHNAPTDDGFPSVPVVKPDVNVFWSMPTPGSGQLTASSGKSIWCWLFWAWPYCGSVPAWRKSLPSSSG